MSERPLIPAEWMKDPHFRRKLAVLDPRPQRVHDSDPDPMPSPHEESCGCHWCTPAGREVFRTVNGIPFERIKIDPRALTFAADDYEAATGHVDEIALGYAILSYLEAQAAA